MRSICFEEIDFIVMARVFADSGPRLLDPFVRVCSLRWILNLNINKPTLNQKDWLQVDDFTVHGSCCANGANIHSPFIIDSLEWFFNFSPLDSFRNVNSCCSLEWICMYVCMSCCSSSKVEAAVYSHDVQLAVVTQFPLQPTFVRDSETWRSSWIVFVCVRLAGIAIVSLQMCCAFLCRNGSAVDCIVIGCKYDNNRYGWHFIRNRQGFLPLSALLLDSTLPRSDLRLLGYFISVRSLWRENY